MPPPRDFTRDANPETAMTQPLMLQTTARSAHRPVQLVLVRANAPLFYSLAAASLLEALAPVYAARVRAFFRGDRAFCEWLDTEWLPRRAARARELREYVEKTWPELDWGGAYEHHRAALEGDGGMGAHQPTAAHEALARCVAAAQSGVFYRALSRWADDAALRKAAANMGREDALAFAQFRAAYERRARVERVGLVAAWRTTNACMRNARDLHLSTAFRAICANCSAQVPFPAIDYAEFLGRMRAVIERLGDLGAAERMLFRPWKGRARVARPEETQQHVMVRRSAFKAAA